MKPELAAEFHQLFFGLERAHGKYVLGTASGAKAKVGGKARTVQEPVTDAVWQAHLEGRVGLGVVPICDDNTCLWGAIDIDIYDGLHHGDLATRINGMGLPLVVCRTKSGGAHLYLFLSEPVKATLVRSKLLEWTVALGYNKSTEIFPKQDTLKSDSDTGNWINMPYFDADQTMRYAVVNNEALEAEEFIEYAKAAKVDAVELAGIRVTTPSTSQPKPSAGGCDFNYGDAPPCLERIISEGCPEGYRNDVLFSLGVYARLKHGDDWEDELDELNHAVMDPPLKSREVLVVAKSLNKKNYFYKCNQPPLHGFCNKELCKTRTFGIDGHGSSPYPIDRPVQKHNTDPPTYSFRIGSTEVRNLPSEVWLCEQKFRVAVYEATNFLAPRMKADSFDAMIRDLSSDMEIIGAPEDASAPGQLLSLVKHFCTGKALAATKDEILLGRPWINNDRVYFRQQDLANYLKNHGFRALPTTKYFAALKRYGAESTVLSIKSHSTYLWNMPVFHEDDQPLDVPAVPRGAY